MTAVARLRPLGWGALACLVLVTLSVAIVDRPVAEAMHASGLAGGPWKSTLQAAQDLAQVPGFIAVPGLILLALWRLAGERVPHWAAIILLACVSLVVADVLKEAGKFGFGRAWPETWVANNPSLIRDGVYGFFPFHGGRGYASFPSGHMTAITAFLGVFAFVVRRAWIAFVIGSAVVAAGLLGLDYHFVGDMIGGSFLGTAVAWTAVTLNRQAAPHIRRIEPVGAAGEHDLAAVHDRQRGA